MFTGRAVAKYLAAVAIGASAGGLLGYELQRLTPQERIRVGVQTGKFAPAVDSKMTLWMKPLFDVLR
jgi:hypothetical protein